MEDFVVGAAGTGEDAVGLLVRHSEGNAALEGGERIFRAADELFRAKRTA